MDSILCTANILFLSQRKHYFKKLWTHTVAGSCILEKEEAIPISFRLENSWKGFLEVSLEDASTILSAERMAV
jgi:hypothetical protein